MKAKIIHISETDIGGGSAFYAYRMHKYLNKIKKANSKMYVLKKNIKDKNIESFDYKINSKFLKYFYFFFLKENNKYSFYNHGKYVIKYYSQVSKIISEKPNAIIIYNNSNVIHPKILNYLNSKKIKIIFYPMDMEIITGGCHYTFECNGFKKNCMSCPAINKTLSSIPRTNLYEKKKFLYNEKITFLSATKNIYDDVSKSSFFNKKKHDNYILNLGLNLKRYKPVFNNKIKHKISISLRSSLNPRKGNQILIKALEYACLKQPDLNKKVEFNIVGDSSILELMTKKEFKCTFKDSIKTEKELIKFYQKSDFFLNQSIQDAGPVMVNESLACGLPVLSFNIGISKDVIINNFNGFLLNNISEKNLGNKIIEISNIKKNLLIKMKNNARKTAIKNFDIKEKAKKILKFIK